MSNKEFGELIIRSLEDDRCNWEVDEHHATHEDGIKMWVANRPYADMTINGYKVGTWIQRWKMRRLIDKMRQEQAAYILEHGNAGKNKMMDDVVRKLVDG